VFTDCNYFKDLSGAYSQEDGARYRRPLASHP
jgi:hypothetical protein